MFTYRKDKRYKMVMQGKRLMSIFRSIRRRSASGILFTMLLLGMTAFSEMSPALKESSDAMDI